MERDDVVSKLQEQLQAMSDQLTRADHAGSFLDTDLVCSACTGCLCGWLAGWLSQCLPLLLLLHFHFCSVFSIHIVFLH